MPIFRTATECTRYLQRAYNLSRRKAKAVALKAISNPELALRHYGIDVSRITYADPTGETAVNRVIASAA